MPRAEVRWLPVTAEPGTISSEPRGLRRSRVLAWVETSAHEADVRTPREVEQAARGFFEPRAPEVADLEDRLLDAQAFGDEADRDAARRDLLDAVAASPNLRLVASDPDAEHS